MNSTPPNLLPRIPLYKIRRRSGRPRMLPLNLTVSLTYRCNSRCMTCNIISRRSAEMDVEEYRRIFGSIGTAPCWVTFSGGEPFLREDIADIASAAYSLMRPGIINIPTNGLLPERVEHGVREIARRCPGAAVIVNLSLDGVGARHDEIRGVKGCFERALETWGRLKSIRSDNLTLGIHTVISRFNAEEIPSIFRQLRELRPDSYITEIAEERVELGTIGAGITPDASAYAAAVDYVSGEMRGWEMKGISAVTRAFRRRYYGMVKEMMQRGRMVIPCYAGVASCQIAPDGEVWACCVMAESMGNLREADCDFRRVWFSEQAGRVRRAIRERDCFCPLANASYTNMIFSLRTLAGVAAEVLLGR